MLGLLIQKTTLTFLLFKSSFISTTNNDNFDLVSNGKGQVDLNWIVWITWEEPGTRHEEQYGLPTAAFVCLFVFEACLHPLPSPSGFWINFFLARKTTGSWTGTGASYTVHRSLLQSAVS